MPHKIPCHFELVGLGSAMDNSFKLTSFSKCNLLCSSSERQGALDTNMIADNRDNKVFIRDADGSVLESGVSHNGNELGLNK